MSEVQSCGVISYNLSVKPGLLGLLFRIKFNYIYQELSEFKQKGTQEVYFQAITKYSFA